MSVKSVQAPIGGINRLASIDDMPESDAYVLDNWVADAGFCRLRGGCVMVDIDVGTDPISTIIAYGDQMIVATGGDLIDTGLTPLNPTSPGGPITTLGSGFASDEWQWEVFNDKLLLVNGVDAPQAYDGTTLAPMTIDPSVSSPEDFVGVNSFKGRSIYWKADSSSFWYAEAGSYQGVLTEFPLGTITNRVATLVSMFTWSADAGDGPDDFFVAVMSTGEALVYQGTDPSSLDYFSLVGKYQMGSPLSYRSAASIAGDQIILTREGWVNFKVVWETGDWKDEGIGRKIVGLAADAVTTYGNQDGWEVHFYPEERIVLVNVPQGLGASIQHVLNTNTMAWSTFSGWNATTFGSYQGRVYFGTIGGDVYLAMEGYDDNDSPIKTDALPAFNYLSGRANNKLLTGVKPITTVSLPDNIGLVGTGDFVIPPAEVPDYVPSNTSGTPWGSPWGSPWSSGTQSAASSQWETIQAYGYALSYRMTTQTAGEQVSWGATQLMFKDAGVI